MLSERVIVERDNVFNALNIAKEQFSHLLSRAKNAAVELKIPKKKSDQWYRTVFGVSTRFILENKQVLILEKVFRHTKLADWHYYSNVVSLFVINGELRVYVEYKDNDLDLFVL